MTDQKILELAAYTIGYEKPNWDDGTWWDGATEQRCKWNPLGDDGDAHRLAVKLEFDILHRVVGGSRVEVMPAGFGSFAEAYKGDPYAATRRAIVRAAAEVGEVLLRKPGRSK